MEYGIVHTYTKVRDKQNLQTPVRFRNPQQNNKGLSIRLVLYYFVRVKNVNCFTFVGIEQSERCGFATRETGEKVLGERSELRNLTLDSN